MKAGKSTIQVRLHELSQLFNSLDPSPFNERDLDADAEEFIVGWARELPPGHTLEVVIQLDTPPLPERAAGLEAVVHHYFAQRMEVKAREFRLLMRRGRTSLMVGLGFLAGCLLVGELLAKQEGSTLARILKESLTICGWVAMWKPMEIYLYNWWPLRAESRVLQRLSRAHVKLVIKSPPASTGTK
jgi:hypothetical protein